MNKINLRSFVFITLFTSVWINLSEVFRYFVLVMPKVKAHFQDQAGIAEMNTGIFAIWGLWDMLLTCILVYVVWLGKQNTDYYSRSFWFTGTLVWMAVFVIFWVATANMGLSSWDLLFITLPLSWIEMVVGALIASKLWENKSYKTAKA